MTGIGDQQLRQRAVGNFALDQRRHGTFGRDFIEVVMTIETRAGHGSGKPTSKIIEESADVFAFLGHFTGLDQAR
jgi:hypothetical protein